MPPRLHFLPWDRPLLPQAVAWLAGDWAGGAPLDLSSLLVIVPTRQSGRRLREAIAGHAAVHGQAAFPPRVLTPDALILSAVAGQASRLEALLAWADVCRAVAPEDFRAVFPVDPPARDLPWALRLAQQFVHLQATLAEGGLCLADVAERAGDEFAETERWQQLAGLEKLHAEKLATLGLRDEQAEKIAAAKNPPLPAGINKIIVLATPDPLPLALEVLAAHARTLPEDVVVFAPAAEAENFDAWGRPLAPVWAQRVLALPDFAQHLHLCPDPAAQAERIAAVALAYDEPDGLLAVGVADAEVLPLLEHALAHAGIAAFNPEGRARRHEQLYQLLAALAALVREPTFAAVAALARCPDFLALLRARFGAGFSSAHWLGGLDKLHAQHLPADLNAARMHATQLEQPVPALQGLAIVAELCTLLTTGEFAASAAAALEEIFAARNLDLARETDAQFAEAATAWTDVLRACASAAARFPGLAPADWWTIALRNFGDSLHPEEKAAGALELQGWLELLWEDAPHLAVAGLNDGRVPELACPAPPWRRAWTLTPRRIVSPSRVSVTALRRWLQCPFRFYLGQVLRMGAVDPAKDELDALDFGTLCHGALEVLGGDPTLRDCRDATVLRNALLAELDRRGRAQFGENLSLPLIIQLESARQRLGQAAAVQADERAAGWVIVEVEKKFTLEFAGLTVSGKIDRIDRHADTGAVRVLDYKTSDSAAAPWPAHGRAPRAGETPRGWATFLVDGQPRVWTDLQLPLYRQAVAGLFPGAVVTCGYFNLPKATGDTGLALWDDYPPDLHAAALRCAEGVCAAIRAGEFWPPSEHERADYDEFAALFHQGVAASVTWEAQS